jgi:hypothetical protein
LSESVSTKLRLLEGYRFKVEFDAEDVPNLVVDEMKPIGEGLDRIPRDCCQLQLVIVSAPAFCTVWAKLKSKSRNSTQQSRLMLKGMKRVTLELQA